MTYSEAIQFLFGLRLFGANFGLETTRRLAALAGNPQEQLRFIHVAGTNGKGSTCAMLESIYRAAGLRVGLFTSPHLVSFRERIQINREWISENDVARLVAELCRTGDAPVPDFKSDAKTDGDNRDAGPTFFEFVTVMALKFFAGQRCDLVIWETGLGGRLDATNIVTPLASVITNIAFDHQQWLGDTLGKIAAEKAGIIKPGVPALTATDAPEALRVIEQTAHEQGAALTHIPPHHASRITRHTSLLGDHQQTNAALALATVDILQPQIPVSNEQIRTGLASVNWPGRLQLVTRPGGQKILLDGAHNVAGAQALRAAVSRLFPGPAPTLILGVLQDKDWRHVCGELAPMARRILTVPVASERTADAQELAAACRTANPATQANACDSLSAALAQTADEPFTVVTGSLYLIGEALERLGVAPAAGQAERGLNEWNQKK